MSIESYDVVRPDHRALSRWSLGIVATFTGMLAVVGWPIPVLPRRYGDAHAGHRNLELIGAWLGHDGWRTSGSSWFWGGVAIVATSWAIALRRRDSGPRRWLVIVLPGLVVAAIGPIVQTLLDLPWSNYSGAGDGVSLVVVYAIALVVAAGLPLLRAWVTRGRAPVEVAPFDRR